MNLLLVLFDAWRAKKTGAAGIEKRQRKRLADIVAFARANSPYYQEFYKNVPERIEDSTRLPVTNKKESMEHFNDVVTDPEAKFEKVRAFVGNPDLIGEYFLDTYTVATTSGTTGRKGIFLTDERSFNVVGALAFRAMSSWLNVGDTIRILANRGRLTMINAMAGHFATAIAAARLKKKRGKRYQVLPVNMPMPELVEKLNQFQPAVLAPYASVGSLLASEQEAGRLNINPVLIVLYAEGLPEKEYQRISKTFSAEVYDSYAATECPFISGRCEYGWLHVNSDWVVLEPVDADYKPTPPGRSSHTVLVTNLANKVQPILRYNLGDSVLQKPEPCKCGNPLPAIRVQGRSSEVLTFPKNGEKVTVAPLVFSAIAARTSGIDLFQLLQTSPTTLRVRLKLSPGTDAAHVWQTVLTEISHVLKEYKLGHVTLEKAEEQPEQTPAGKYKEVIPLK